MAELSKTQIEQLLRDLVRDHPHLREALCPVAGIYGFELPAPEDERIFALRELTAPHSEAWSGLDMSDIVHMLRDGLAAYDELKASLPTGDRKVVEEWGVRTRGNVLHTLDIGGYPMTSRETAEQAGFDKQTEPEPVLLRRVTTFTEKIGDER